MPKNSLIPASLIGSIHLGRYVLRPDGPKGISFTLSMYDTGIPDGTGGTWIGYRLYQRPPDGDRKGSVLFENRLQAPTPTKDPADLAKLILDTLAVGPGDISPDPTESYTPEQLAWATKWGAKVRQAAKEKFGWMDKDLKPLRADFLDITYKHRDDYKAHKRHQMNTGVIQVSARTKREAVADLRAAIQNHISALPQFKVGEVSKQVYCLFPHGAEQVIQVVRPQHPESPLGDSLRFKAKDLEDAKRTFGVWTRGLEAPAEPITKFISFTHAPEPSPKELKPEPTKEDAPPLFDSPIPKKKGGGFKGLPGGLLGG